MLKLARSPSCSAMILHRRRVSSAAGRGTGIYITRSWRLGKIIEAESRMRRDWRLAENQTRRWMRLLSMQLYPVSVRVRSSSETVGFRVGLLSG